MRVTTLSIASLLVLVATPGCSSSDSSGAPPADSGVDTAVADSAKSDVAADGASEAADSTFDSGPTDAAIDDTPPGVTFPCGTETCSATFQYCRQSGTCVAADAGADVGDATDAADATAADATAADVGDGGACVRKCEALPSDCFGGASCTCILNAVCGSPSSGTCDEKPANAFTVACTP